MIHKDLRKLERMQWSYWTKAGTTHQGLQDKPQKFHKNCDTSTRSRHVFSYKQQVNVFHFPVAAGKDSNTLYLVSCLHLHISPFRLGADLSIFAETLLHRNALPLPWQQYRTQGKKKKAVFIIFFLSLFSPTSSAVASDPGRCASPCCDAKNPRRWTKKKK